MKVEASKYIIDTHCGTIYNGIREVSITFYEGEAELFKEEIEKILDIASGMVKVGKELVGEKPTIKSAV